MASVTAFVSRRPAGGRPHHNLDLDGTRDLKLLKGPWAKGFALALAVAYFVIPGSFEDTTLRTLCYCGVYAIGAIGLNLLTGYTGQVSLGHAAFFGAGAYCAAYLGSTQGWPFFAYTAASVVVGLAIGGLIGPFAARLRGNYLAVVTIGLLFLAEHVFKNWTTVTGGGSGVTVANAEITIGPLDFRALEVAGLEYTFPQGMFWLIWAFVALTALLAKNVVRSRAGRAMQAIRDRDLSAEIIGVQPTRYKVAAFALAGACAALAGSFYALLQNYVNPSEFGGRIGLFLSITFVAMIIMGGIGTIYGSILGALLVEYGRRFIAERGADAPIFGLPVEKGWLTPGELNGVLFGGLIVFFLLIEPRGLAALWMRVRTWFMSWPFSY
ncbi:MAG: branched-chain amino acid ABC transporter permease [Acidimicrobiales bacterium]